MDDNSLSQQLINTLNRELTDDTKELLIKDIITLRDSFLGWYWKATNGNLNEQLNAMTISLDYVPLGCLLIEKLREKMTGQKIDYLITSELKNDSKKSKELIRNKAIKDIRIIKDEDFIYSHALSSQLYQSKRHQQIKINYNLGVETVKDLKKGIYEQIIESRVQYVKNYYESSRSKKEFETYYGINGKKPDFKNFEMPIKIKMSNYDRLKYWMKKINNENTNLKTKIEGEERIIVLNLDKNQTTLYAKIEKNENVYSMIINQGHLYEGLLHGAASLNLNASKLQQEFNAFRDNKIYKYTGKPKYNIDEAMIMAQGQDPFFQKGDVIFNFWDEEKGKIQQKYYQAKKNNASISISTIVNAANSLYNILTSDFLTPNKRTELIIDFFIKDKNKMDKLEEQAHEQIKNNVPFLLGLDIQKK